MSCNYQLIERVVALGGNRKIKAASFFVCVSQVLNQTLTQVFSCEYCKIFKNSFFYRTPLVTASNFYLTFLDLESKFSLSTRNPFTE